MKRWLTLKAPYKASASEPPMKCRKRIRRCQNRGLTLPLGSVWGNPEACPGGIRHVGGAKLNQALIWNVRTSAPMPREKRQAAQTASAKVPMRRMRDGAARSSGEGPVMGLERRGCVVQLWLRAFRVLGSPRTVRPLANCRKGLHPRLPLPRPLNSGFSAAFRS